MTATRVSVSVLVGALLLGVIAWSAAPRSDSQLFVGSFGPDRGIAIQNLTVDDGYYLLGYSMDVFVAPNPGLVGVDCSIEDTSGRLADLPGLDRTAAAGEWVTMRAQTVLDLPDATLGVRCFAQREALLEISVRNVVLTVQRSD